jgi:hypothetical protein
MLGSRPLAACLFAVCAGACAPEAAYADETPPAQLQVATLAAPGCAARAGDPRELVPDDAIGLVGLDLAVLRGTEVFKDVEAALRSDPAIHDAFAAAERCGMGPDAWRGLTVGVSATGDMALVVQATGLGKAATLDCLSTEIAAQTGTAPWTRRGATCATTLDFEGGTEQAWTLDDDSLVIATTGWSSAVEARRAGRGASAKRGKLAWAWSRVDATRPLWFAVEVPPVVTASLGGVSTGLRDVGGTTDLTVGVDMAVTAGFDRAAEAKAAETELKSQLAKASVLAPMFGIPTGVLSGVRISARGAQLDLTAKISEADLSTLRALLRDTLGVAAPAPSPTPPPMKSPPKSSAI